MNSNGLVSCCRVTTSIRSCPSSSYSFCISTSCSFYITLSNSNRTTSIGSSSNASIRRRFVFSTLNSNISRCRYCRRRCILNSNGLVCCCCVTTSICSCPNSSYSFRISTSGCFYITLSNSNRATSISSSS